MRRRAASAGTAPKRFRGNAFGITAPLWDRPEGEPSAPIHDGSGFCPRICLTCELWKPSSV